MHPDSVNKSKNDLRWRETVRLAMRFQKFRFCGSPTGRGHSVRRAQHELKYQGMQVDDTTRLEEPSTNKRLTGTMTSIILDSNAVVYIYVRQSSRCGNIQYSTYRRATMVDVCFDLRKVEISIMHVRKRTLRKETTWRERVEISKSKFNRSSRSDNTHKASTIQYLRPDLY